VDVEAVMSLNDASLGKAPAAGGLPGAVQASDSQKESSLLRAYLAWPIPMVGGPQIPSPYAAASHILQSNATDSAVPHRYPGVRATIDRRRRSHTALLP